MLCVWGREESYNPSLSRKQYSRTYQSDPDRSTMGAVRGVTNVLGKSGCVCVCVRGGGEVFYQYFTAERQSVSDCRCPIAGILPDSSRAKMPPDFNVFFCFCLFRPIVYVQGGHSAPSMARPRFY